MEQTIIIWYGLRRSGNHGIQQLIFNSSKCEYVHLNDIGLNYDKFLKYSEILKTKTKNDHDYSGFKNIPLVLLSIENSPLSNIELLQLKKFEGNNIKKILILRNPFNNLASVWKVYKKNINILLSMRNLWIIYADKIINGIMDINFIFILYDKFYNDSNYRNEIFNELGFKFKCDDNFLNVKNGYAESSFIDIKDGKLNEFNRYSFYEDDEFFIKEVMENEDLNKLWNEICIKYEIKK